MRERPTLAEAPTFSGAEPLFEPAAERSPDTALLGAALALCGLALAGAGVVTRVRREAGMA